ncbi:uncharacterized protein V1510DRAFT_366315 [Dipodascopsis tothii]|uniref:uncharacterized protein n=1 Tax=Dipodascopsis tothii TaxID=44089 RepID=UPI0034CF496A
MSFDDQYLCDALRRFPGEHTCTYDDEIERALRKLLFTSLSKNGEYLSLFFPAGIPHTKDEWIMTNALASAEGLEGAMHTGRPCMHKFSKGEPTYRCKNCGLDETCVLCARCFNASEHEGHQVSVSISQKDGGGVCDCGDPEAWTREINCKYYRPQNSKDSKSPSQVPSDLLLSIRGTISRALDYVLDVFSCSPQNFQDLKHEQSILGDAQHTKLRPEVYGEPSIPTEWDGCYALVLWNDEKHSYADVKDVVKRATHRKEPFGQYIAERVDRTGREIVMVSSDLKELLTAREMMDMIQLAVTIRTTYDIAREAMCGTILAWLNDLAASPLLGQPFILRDIICEELFHNWRIGSSAFRIKESVQPVRLGLDESEDEIHIVTIPLAQQQQGQAQQAGTVQPAQEQIAVVDGQDAQRLFYDDSIALTESSSGGVGNQALSHWHDQNADSPSRVRLDYLLLFDLRLWKSCRLCLRDLLVSTALSNPDYKRLIGIHFAALYSDLIELYIIADREPECSIVALSTQLFTCPSIATEIADSSYFTVFLSALYTYVTKGAVGPPSAVDPTASVPHDLRTLKNRRFTQIFHDLDFVISRNTSKDKISGSDRRVLQFADLVLLFQGCSPFVRQVHQHVEYESNQWISFFHVLTPLLKLGRAVARGSAHCEENGGRPSITAHRAIHTIARLTTAWALGHFCARFTDYEPVESPKFHALSANDFSCEPYDVVDYTVAHQPVSLHHPLHAFLSWFVEFGIGDIKSPDELRDILSFSREDPPFIGSSTDLHLTGEDMLLVLFDYPLRVIVALAQIRIGLWVRNGYSIRSQQAHYKEITMRDSGFSRDVFGLQTLFAVCSNPSRVLLTYIDRWNLIPWLNGAVEDSIFDETQLMYMVEECLHLLTVVLCERQRLLGGGVPTEEVKRKLVTREIIQVLCFQPLAFSELSKRIPEFLASDELFEVILKEITNFKPPEGLNDHGTYELKKEFFSRVDTYYMHYTATQRDDAESVVKKVLSSQTKTPLEGVVLEPPLLPIHSGPFRRLGRVTTTPEFIQLMFVTISNAVFSRLLESSSLPETLFNMSLYLCHVAALEDSSRIVEPGEEQATFAYNSCTLLSSTVGPPDAQQCHTLTELLFYIKNNQSRDFKYASGKPVVDRILEIFEQVEPQVFQTVSHDIIGNSTGSMSIPGNETEESSDTETAAEKRKRMAKLRQANIMAEFKKQQMKFAEQNKSSMQGDNGADDEDMDDDDLDDMSLDGDDRNEHDDLPSWKFPSGTCILCRKAFHENDIFGTIAMVSGSSVFRQTPFQSTEWMVDAVTGPQSLDVPPTYNVGGESSKSEDNTIGRGFPKEAVSGRVVTGSCVHVLHMSCYEGYLYTARLRHNQQVARNHPENISKGEFLCPLCKSLNNAFLPVIWRPMKTTFHEVLSTSTSFSDWIVTDVWNNLAKMKKPQGENDPLNPISSKLNPHIINSLEETAVSILTPYFAKQYQTAVEDVSGKDRALGAYEDIISIFSTYEGFAKSNQRHMESVQKTYLKEGQQGEDVPLFYASMRLYGTTISASEIALRGSTELGACLLDQVSQRQLSFLRVLRQSVLLQASLAAVPATSGTMSATFSQTYNQQLGQLFFGQDCMYDTDTVKSPNVVPPLLTEDLFLFLADVSVCLMPAMKVEFHHIMVLCYIAQIVKVFYLLGDQINRQQNWLFDDRIEALGMSVQSENIADEVLLHMKDFILTILRDCGNPAPSTNDLFMIVPGRTIYALTLRFILPFLRKTALLAYVSGPVGYDPDSLYEQLDNMASANSNGVVEEVDKLLTLLRLPRIEEVFLAFSTSQGNSSTGLPESNKNLSNIVFRWCCHLSKAARKPKTMQRFSLSLEFPRTIDLLRLPTRLDGFFQEVVAAKCKGCKAAPVEPAVCLFCGEIVCCQSSCCFRDNLGECNRHIASCAGDVGIYLLIKKCTVLFLREQQGLFTPAPYLDIHGEVDQNLKRGRPLYLSQKRYDHLIKSVWLQHGIASQIARRIEASLDTGGWETL